MKLKLLKAFRMARPKVWEPQWTFTKDQEIETDDEYLIDQLLTLKVAKILDKSLESETKQHLTPKNKMLEPEKVTKRRGRPKKAVDENELDASDKEAAVEAAKTSEAEE